MEKENKKLDTRQLNEVLKKSNNFMEIIEKNDDNFFEISLSEYLNELLNRHHLKISDIIFASNLSKSYVYQLFKGERLASRDIILRIAFAMQLNLNEVILLLSISNNGALYSRIKRDAAIIFCLNKGMNLVETEDLLNQLGEKSIIGEG